MADINFTVRIDESLKKKFDAVCADFGMSAQTAVTIFAKTVVRERKIPFEIALHEQDEMRELLQTFLSMKEQKEMEKLHNMTLEEINEEISHAKYDDIENN